MTGYLFLGFGFGILMQQHGFGVLWSGAMSLLIYAGSTNRWFFEIDGMDCSAKFSSDDANAFHYTSSWGKEQSWNRVVIGYKPMIPTITGPIFEFGFTDAMQQQLAAFVLEYTGQEVPFGLFTPEETALSHKLCTAALRSHYDKTVETL